MGPKPANEPFEPDLEIVEINTGTSSRGNTNLKYGSGDQALEKTHGSSTEIVHTPSADLEEHEKEEGNKKCYEGGSIDGNNLLSQRIRELGIDDLAVLEVYRK